MLKVYGHFDLVDMKAAKTYNEQTLMNSAVTSYYYDMMNVQLLRNIGFNGGTMKCAVIDTGCDLNHPQLKGKIIAVRNFTNEGGPADVTDYNGHGTHVAGLIAGDSTGPFKGGVAPGAKLVICKVLDKNGQGGYDAIINAINYAIDNKVNVINMSLGGPSNVPGLYDAIKRAYEAGIVIVCA